MVSLAARRALLAPRALRGSARDAALPRRPRALRAPRALDGRHCEAASLGRRPVGDPPRRTLRALRADLARQRERRLPDVLVALEHARPGEALRSRASIRTDGAGQLRALAQHEMGREQLARIVALHDDRV